MTLVRNIASECKHAVAPKENPRVQGGKAFDIESFLTTHGINVTKKVSISTGTKYQLAQCPFDESHQHGDTAVFAYSNGSYGFHCFHNSCAGYHWHEFRQKIDPAAYVNSPFTVHQAVNIPKPSGLLSSTISGTSVKTGQPRMLDFAEIPNYDRRNASIMLCKHSPVFGEPQHLLIAS